MEVYQGHCGMALCVGTCFIRIEVAEYMPIATLYFTSILLLIVKSLLVMLKSWIHRKY